MRIALDAQLIAAEGSYRSAGVSGYSRNLLRALGELAASGATRHTFTAFVNVADAAAPGLTLEQTRLPLHRPTARILWEQTALPLHLRRVEADAVHGLVNVLPLAATATGIARGVVTVHDLSFLRTPGMLPAAKRSYLARLAAASVRSARAVIAVSTQTADDLRHFFNTPTRKIVVVPNGVSAAFSPGESGAAAAFRRAKGLPERFWLYLGTLEPRKNLPLLLRAYARWRAAAPPGQRDVALVLAGARGWFYTEIFQLVTELGLREQVIFPGFVPGAELAEWYRAAFAFVYPSLLEGFGLPVLEAMACGAPVLCSAIPALHEVAGDAALTFDPRDEDALAALLQLAAGQDALRTELGRRGVTRAQGFTWARTARETVAVYDAL